MKIPHEFTAKLDIIIPELGYHSRAEVVNDAVRRFIDERALLSKEKS